MTRILVVEDEPGIALGLEDDLKMEGYEVEVLGDGAEAARRARQAPFDLILLDVMLPGKDGFEVCRELRRAGLRTPILMLTAKTQEAEKVLGFELGADDYVTKPFGTRELRARIKALLRRASAEPPARHLPFRRSGGGFRTRRAAAQRAAFGAHAHRVQAAGAVRSRARPRHEPRSPAGRSLGPRYLCQRPHRG